MEKQTNQNIVKNHSMSINDELLDIMKLDSIQEIKDKINQLKDKINQLNKENEENEENDENDENDEELLDDRHFRLTVLPITQKFKILYDLYEKQEESFWQPKEIDFSSDYADYLKLTPDEQHFIKMVLAFFAASDGIVNFNLRDRFLTEIKVFEAQLTYGFQLAMEGIHGIVYSNMLMNIIKDPEERDMLFNAIKTIEPVKNMANWAIKWIKSQKHISYRIIAFAIVEGVFFSGAFASIFWLKKERSGGKLFMPGLVKSNKFISRDEGMHTEFACVLYSYIKNRVSQNEVYEMFDEAVEIAYLFCKDAIRVDMIGMNLPLMLQYIKYISDRLLVSLSYNKKYFEQNPFDFMETISLDSKDNFFENRPDAYQMAYNDNNANWQFNIPEDF